MNTNPYTPGPEGLNQPETIYVLQLDLAIIAASTALTPVYREMMTLVSGRPWMKLLSYSQVTRVLAQEGRLLIPAPIGAGITISKIPLLKVKRPRLSRINAPNGAPAYQQPAVNNFQDLPIQ